VQRNIVGRGIEKDRLNQMLIADEPAFLSVYGRRRVGKTYLVREYFKDHLVFDFTGSKDVGLPTQLSNFHDEYLRRTKSKFKTALPTSWNEAFTNLAEFLISQKSSNKKRVVFIDEMPWLDTPKSEFVASLEYFWNQYLAKMNDVILVACGSVSSWIRKNLINARGGLYNRVTHRIRLKPFTLEETEQFLKYKKISLPRFQIIELYMALGGIPFYLKSLSPGKSVSQLIDQLFFEEDAPLSDEYAQLYTSLFKNAEPHETIAKLLAQHPQGMTRQEILNTSKIPNGTLSRALEELVECDFVGLFQPFGKKKKDSIYRMIDNFTLFYMKFVEGKNYKRGVQWLALSREQSYKSWSGFAFENICLQHIPQIIKDLGIDGMNLNSFAWKTTGSKEGEGAQVDLILDRADKTINLCEVKFSSTEYVSTKEYAEKLRKRTSIFQNNTKTKKAIFNTLITLYPAIKNEHYFDQFQNQVNMDALFVAI
jgi:uncharacterized protein